MVGRHLVRGIRILGVADHRDRGSNHSKNHRRLIKFFIGKSSWSKKELPGSKHSDLDLIVQKKTARTFCCSCREASDANYSRL